MALPASASRRYTPAPIARPGLKGMPGRERLRIPGLVPGATRAP